MILRNREVQVHKSAIHLSSMHQFVSARYPQQQRESTKTNKAMISETYDSKFDLMYCLDEKKASFVQKLNGRENMGFDLSFFPIATPEE